MNSILLYLFFCYVFCLQEPSRTTQLKTANLQSMVENKVNLSPKRQNPSSNSRTNSSKSRHSTKSYHSVDSTSTCSSNDSGISHKTATGVKPQNHRLTLLQQELSSSASSSQTSFCTTDITATHDGSVRTMMGPSSASLDIGKLPSAQTGSLLIDGAGDTTAFRLSLQQKENITGQSHNRKLAVCEAVSWSFQIHSFFITKNILCCVSNCLKVPVPKPLQDDFCLTNRYGHFPNNKISKVKKIANLYLVCKQCSNHILKFVRGVFTS